MVRANFRMRWNARALMPSWDIAARSRFFPASSSRQCSRTSAGPTLVPALQVQAFRHCRAGAHCPPSRPARRQSAFAVLPLLSPHACGHRRSVRPGGNRSASRTPPAAPRCGRQSRILRGCALRSSRGPEPALSNATGCACGWRAGHHARLAAVSLLLRRSVYSSSLIRKPASSRSSTIASFSDGS